MFFFPPQARDTKTTRPLWGNNEQSFLHPRRQQAPFEAPKVNSRSAGGPAACRGRGWRRVQMFTPTAQLLEKFEISETGLCGSV